MSPRLFSIWPPALPSLPAVVIVYLHHCRFSRLWIRFLSVPLSPFFSPVAGLYSILSLPLMNFDFSFGTLFCLFPERWFVGFNVFPYFLLGLRL